MFSPVSTEVLGSAPAASYKYLPFFPFLIHLSLTPSSSWVWESGKDIIKTSICIYFPLWNCFCSYEGINTVKDHPWAIYSFHKKLLLKLPISLPPDPINTAGNFSPMPLTYFHLAPVWCIRSDSQAVIGHLHHCRHDNSERQSMIPCPGHTFQYSLSVQSHWV